MSEATFRNEDGLSIFTRSWHPTTKARAIVIIVPGFNSHSGYYGWVAEQFNLIGLSVHSLDLRGRGNSEGERFFVRTFDDYVKDLKSFIEIVKSEEPDLPVFLLGHSAGGIVSCLYALQYQSELSGFICESFAFQVPAPEFALALFKGLEHLAAHKHVLRLKNKDFSRNPEIVEKMDHDPLIENETQPIQTLAELVRTDEKLKNEFFEIKIPVLILHGTADKAAKYSGSEFFFRNVGSTDKSLKLYDGGYHDLLNDSVQRDVMQDILDWTENHLKDRKRVTSDNAEFRKVDAG